MNCTVRIGNYYANRRSKAEAEVEEPEFPDDEEYMEEWWNLEVFPHTGDGKGGNALSEVVITRSDNPALVGLRYEWQG